MAKSDYMDCDHIAHSVICISLCSAKWTRN
jgi:hypothetical protein